MQVKAANFNTVTLKFPWRINPIQGGGGGSDQITFREGVILRTPSNFWTTDERELKFYMVIDIHNLFQKIEKNQVESVNYAFMTP